MTLTNNVVHIPARRLGAARLDAPAARSADPLHTAKLLGTPGTLQAPDGGVDWQEAAMRLKAEMQNYRRRQQRLAEDEAGREKARLLRRFLDVVDSFEQSLEHLNLRDPVHQGVQLAYDGILALLIREGVERTFAQGRAFDPDLHEAVATVPVRPGGVADMHVAEVLLRGYRYGDQVLRPAKVVVARDNTA
ncbi:MAG: nucleotide exchange factor GrpE [Anaerolineae bacterium]|nr:nucleotide exchange factor GrpE [Anaerolineae bacterium]